MESLALTSAEINEIIRKYYPTHEAKVIGEMIGVDDVTVRRRANRMGLTKYQKDAKERITVIGNRTIHKLI